MLESAQAASWRDRTKLAGGALPVAVLARGWWRLWTTGSASSRCRSMSSSSC